jgi:hypothetical protein
MLRKILSAVVKTKMRAFEKSEGERKKEEKT